MLNYHLEWSHGLKFSVGGELPHDSYIVDSTLALLLVENVNEGFFLLG
jgi:hypothetical protein